MTSSTFTGYINKDNTAKNIVLNVDEDSIINLTSDSYVSTLNNNGKINYNGYKLYVNGVAIN